MRTFEPEVVAKAAPVEDQARWRMWGGMLLGRAFSLKRTGFCPLKVWEKRSFLSGRLRAGAGMVEMSRLRSARRCAYKQGRAAIGFGRVLFDWERLEMGANVDFIESRWRNNNRDSFGKLVLSK
jgi:hypothetical protein